MTPAHRELAHKRGNRRSRDFANSNLSRRATRVMLEQELAKLSSELPASVCTTIQPSDTDFAIQTLARRGDRGSRVRIARQAAAGIAWERAIIAHVQHLADTHDTLEVIAERWCPAGKKLDLDLVVYDRRKAVVWVLDAKLSSPSNDQVSKMYGQMRLLRAIPELTRGCPTIVGVIVHHRRQLQTSLIIADQPRILRCTLQEVGDLLLARRLPHCR